MRVQLHQSLAPLAAHGIMQADLGSQRGDPDIVAGWFWLLHGIRIAQDAAVVNLLAVKIKIQIGRRCLGCAPLDPDPHKVKESRRWHAVEF